MGTAATPPHESIEQSASTGSDADVARLAFLEAVVDATHDAVVSIDGDGVVTSWNRSAERIFGWSDTDIVGEPVAMLFVPAVRSTIEWFLDVVASGDRIDRFETDIERKGGMHTPITLSLSPVVGPDGTVAGAAAVARDLTEQRLAQATLAETEARMREGESLAHVGRWLWDIGSGTVQWSDELHRIHDVDPVDFGGDLEAHVAAVIPADRERVLDALQRAVELGRPFEQEYDIVATDDEPHHLYARAEPTVDANGSVVGLRGIVQDVSGRPPASYS